MSILTNKRQLDVARGKVEAHCMHRTSEIAGDYLYVYFPQGFSLDGVRVSLANGKAWAYGMALAKMESVWNEDLPDSLRGPKQ